MMKLSALLILAALLLVGCTQQSTYYNSSQAANQSGAPVMQAQPGHPSGSVVFTISDNAVDMNSISSVNVTVNSIMMHSPSGWTTVSSTPSTFDLLQLKSSGVQALLGEANVTNGTYDQISMEISNSTVTDSSGDHEAKLPSGDLKIMGPFTINSSSVSVISFDFVASDSIHQTGNGEYIMAPVVHLQSKNGANVTVQNGQVQINGGNLNLDSLVGMDENGSVNYGVQIPPDANVSIDDNGAIKVGNGDDNNGSHGNEHSH